jgi:hypothetical protein
MIRGDSKEKESRLKQVRSLLDWFEKHNVVLPDTIYFQNNCYANVWVTDTDGGHVVKACLLDKIKVEKIYDESSFTLRFYVENSHVRFSRVVGTRTVPAITYPEHVENVIEWECKDSIKTGGGRRRCGKKR